MKILVTGGAGFIGSAFVRMALDEDTAWRVVNLDKLTYAGNLENLAGVSESPRYRFVRGDIADGGAVMRLFAGEKPDAVVHFAAESHVDRSILSPEPAVRTNLYGTFCLLEAARVHQTPLFLHVSTDEVYGSLEEPLEADENFPLQPSSPYSASKAGSDLLALSYGKTFKLPVIVTRASNNYGPYQFPEKLIPLMISNAMEDKPLPIYGDGMQVRDWLFVDDHCRALLAVLDKGRAGEIYNVGGSLALPNKEVVRRILAATGKSESLMRYVADRPAHDRRYALSSEKVMRETGWAPRMPFDEGLALTVRWYRENIDWVRHVKSGEYMQYYERNYAHREP
ncbi:MAG: dTDP-glucose 4,6-dehydratase [Acidobacteria bacterium]|nr:dTDP-glucose 4,6-dehydratase [Acidobacteriota bacterium]